MKEVILLDEEKARDIFELVPDKSPLKCQRVYCPLKRGSATFHDGRTIHFAGKNTTDQPRRVLSVIYMADGTTYNGTSHPFADQVDTLEKGGKFEGELFPVIAG